MIKRTGVFILLLASGLQASQKEVELGVANEAQLRSILSLRDVNLTPAIPVSVAPAVKAPTVQSEENFDFFGASKKVGDSLIKWYDSKNFTMEKKQHFVLYLVKYIKATLDVDVMQSIARRQDSCLSNMHVIPKNNETLSKWLRNTQSISYAPMIMLEGPFATDKDYRKSEGRLVSTEFVDVLWNSSLRRNDSKIIFTVPHLYESMIEMHGILRLQRHMEKDIQA